MVAVEGIKLVVYAVAIRYHDFNINGNMINNMISNMINKIIGNILVTENIIILI